MATGSALAGLLMLAASVAPATAPMPAVDGKAAFLVSLFSDACLSHVGDPAAVQAWAEARKLAPVEDGDALRIFVGSGPYGGAWTVPSAQGRFVVSIRGATQACAVWAQTADPGQVEGAFRTLVGDAARPGVEVSVVRETTRETAQTGRTRLLAYRVASAGDPRALVYSMLTTERWSGAYPQASLHLLQTHEGAPAKP